MHFIRYRLTRQGRKALALRRQAAETVLEAKRRLRLAGKQLPTSQRLLVEQQIAQLQQLLQNHHNGPELATAQQQLLAWLQAHTRAWQALTWQEHVTSLLGVIVTVLLVRFFLVEAFQIPSGSMIPTLEVGDKILVNKLVYGLRVPLTHIKLLRFFPVQRGDVIVFRCPEPPHEDYIKRVVAIGGDRIAVKNGVIVLNGQSIEHTKLAPRKYWDYDMHFNHWYEVEAMEVAERLGNHAYVVLQDLSYLHPSADFAEYQVPKHHVFAMGDNRDHSHDSRFWGAIPENDIVGQSMLVWWSWGHQGLNWQRMMRWIP